ncbi:hypothetical protein HY11_01540 [Hyphomonas pacifica]|nr:hypothetical protein HY11_01540 [Hyphomonas pacifica]
MQKSPHTIACSFIAFGCGILWSWPDSFTAQAQRRWSGARLFEFGKFGFFFLLSLIIQLLCDAVNVRVPAIRDARSPVIEPLERFQKVARRLLLWSARSLLFEGIFRRSFVPGVFLVPAIRHIALHVSMGIVLAWKPSKVQ